MARLSVGASSLGRQLSYLEPRTIDHSPWISWRGSFMEVPSGGIEHAGVVGIFDPHCADARFYAA